VTLTDHLSLFSLASFFRLHFKLPDDVWLVDLDANKVVKPVGVEDVPPLPEREGNRLRRELEQALSLSAQQESVDSVDVGKRDLLFIFSYAAQSLILLSLSLVLL
jgi:hypothetical protein